MPFSLLAQEDDDLPPEDETDVIKGDANGKGFKYGFFFGPGFSNNYSANLYDGYGYDIDGNRNSFSNSFMYNKIIVEYGGGNGQPDRIGQSIGADPGNWSFNETDMPTTMRYATAYVVGIQTRYNTDRMKGFIFNANASKLNVNGVFTINTVNSQAVNGQFNNNIKTFPIQGKEQRIVIQAGYQRILGDSKKKMNLFVEGGFNLNMSKFEKNFIVINDLMIDLTTFYNFQGYVQQQANLRTGVSLGFFSGIGVNLAAGKKWNAQFLYSPSYDKIKIGFNPLYKLHHLVGFRALRSF